MDFKNIIKKLAIYVLALLSISAKAENNKLIFKLIQNNKYLVLEAEEKNFHQILGHKILDTISIQNVPKTMWEKAYLNPEKVFLERKEFSYSWSKAFALIQETATGKYVKMDLKDKTLRSFTKPENIPHKKINWFLLAIMLMTIASCFLLINGDREVNKHYQKFPENFIIGYLLWPRIVLVIPLIETLAALCLILLVNGEGGYDLWEFLINILWLYLIIFLLFNITRIIIIMVKVRAIKKGALTKRYL